MKKYGLNELYIERDQQEGAHLCTCEYQIVQEEESLYKDINFLHNPLGWYRYKDVFSGEIVKLGHFYNKVAIYNVMEEMEENRFDLNVEPYHIEKEYTLNDIQRLWNIFQEKKGKGFQKTIGIRK